MKKKMQAGGVVKSQPKRVGPVDPNGAWTKVQERNLPPVNTKTKVSLAPDKELGAKKGEPIPAGKLAAAAKKPGKLGQRARLAQTLKKMKK